MSSENIAKSLNIMTEIIHAQDNLQSAYKRTELIIKETPDLYPVAEDVRIDLETALEAIHDAEIASNRLFNNINGARQ